MFTFSLHLSCRFIICFILQHIAFINSCEFFMSTSHFIFRASFVVFKFVSTMIKLDKGFIFRASFPIVLCDVVFEFVYLINVVDGEETICLL